MFDSATVEVNLHPVVSDLFGKGLVVVEGVGVAKEIPR